MVQRPFSEIGGGQVLWNNISMSSSPYQIKGHAALFPGYVQGKKLYNNQRPRISTILSAVDTLRSIGSSSKFKLQRRENRQQVEIRSARETFENYTYSLPSDTILFPIDNSLDRALNNSFPDEITVERVYHVPRPSQFFPPVEDQILHKSELETNYKLFQNQKLNGNASEYPQEIFTTNLDGNEKSIDEVDFNARKLPEHNVNIDKEDFLVEEMTHDRLFSTFYNYSVPTNSNNCVVLQQYEADIDAQMKFSELTIEVCIHIKVFCWR